MIGDQEGFASPWAADWYLENARWHEGSSPLLSSPCRSVARIRAVLSAAVIAMVSIASASEDVAAQQAPRSRVLQVWVDPHYGDNTQALLRNPGPSMNPSLQCVSTDTKPHNVMDANGNPLLNASAPFKTVTDAVAYIRTLYPSGLPALNQHSNVVTSHVIIHCLPGLYSPQSGGRLNDVHTGLQYNGETFPIVLPENVSIQGTSALNTLFIADGSQPVFELGNSANAFLDIASLPNEGEVIPRQFLANIAVTGAIRDSDYSDTFPEHGAGIWIDKQRQVALMITDCYIYCNATGILVDAIPPQQGFHSIWLINNTFAWNACGIWNGEIHRGTGVTTMSVGRSHVSMINNVLDTSPPITYPNNSGTAPLTEIPLPIPPQTPPQSGPRPIPEWWARWKSAMEQVRTGGRNLLWKAVPAVGGGFFPASVSSAFEGVDGDDLDGLVGGVRQNFNAYETAPAGANSFFFGPTNTSSNYFTTLTAEASMLLTFIGLHRTTERKTNSSGQSVRPPFPSHDITTYTNQGTDGSFGRGILFVRDLLHEGARNAGGPLIAPFLVSGSSGDLFDICVGDFRLSPGCRAAGFGTAPGIGVNVQGLPPLTQQVPAGINVLVDQGFPFVDANGSLGLTMGNGETVFPDAIQLGSGDDPSFDLNPWEWDVEGFGNPRVFDHPVHPNGGSSMQYTVDLGADELDMLVVAGYREGTTTFIGRDPFTGGPLSGAWNDFQWYLCASSGLGGVDPAFPGAGTPPTVPAFSSALIGGPVRSNAANWTALHEWSLAGWQPSPPPSASYYGSTYVDVIPYLLPDIHPWHPAFGMGRMKWQACQPGVNMFLYWDPTVGIINPVGTYRHLNAPVPLIRWLDIDWTQSLASWLPEPSQNLPLTNDSSVNGGWCYLASQAQPAPTFLQPTTFAHWGVGTNALRVSCEWLGTVDPWLLGNDSNLQSFMVWR